jgi:ABC-2 type transport system permease protein
VGKFLGLIIFLSILVVYILIMLSTLNIWSDIDFGYLLSNSLGLILLAASFAALGIYFSSLTSQPIVAAILSFIALFALMGLDKFFGSQPDHWFGYISLMKHFQSFSRGVIDSKDIVYFILFITTFLVLTIRRLDSDRLTG